MRHQPVSPPPRPGRAALAARPAAPRPDPARAPLRPGAPIAPQAVLQLQRRYGNRAVGALLRAGGVVQRKLKEKDAESLATRFRGWGLHFEWTIDAPGFELPVRMHQENYVALLRALIAADLDHAADDVELLRSKVSILAQRGLLISGVPYVEQIDSGLDGAVLDRVSDLLSRKENAWILGEFPSGSPEHRSQIIRMLMGTAGLQVNSLQEENALIAWREGLLEGTDVLTLSVSYIPTKSSGAKKKVKDTQCGDFSLMMFLGLKDLKEAAALFGKSESGETENIDILRVLGRRNKPLAVPRPTPWPEAEPAMLENGGPWYVLVYFGEPSSPETIGHAVHMRLLAKREVPGEGEIAFESGTATYAIYDPQGNLDVRKPLDGSRYVVAWGS